jgi:hypothetical protein
MGDVDFAVGDCQRRQSLTAPDQLPSNGACLDELCT